MLLGLFEKKYTVVIIVIGVALLYLPGVTGTFMFDDFNTLKPLDHWNNIGYFEKLWLYITSGFTGPGGRPISLLTFYLNSSSWPAEPRPFLLTNVAIHALNSGLVYFGVNRVALLAGVERPRANALSLLVSALWGLHPLHTSSVLYIVQRMTLLSATFSLLAIHFYLNARSALCVADKRGMFVNGCLVGACAMLAFFSKENAAILPIQVLLIEIFLQNYRKINTKIYKVLFWGCLVLPSMAVIGYLLKLLINHLWNFGLTGAEATYGRSFTMTERLLTQQRVLGDYLLSLLFPKMQTSGVYFDNYPISHSLFQPASTAFWFCFHLFLILFSFLKRKKWPWLFLAIWWFYGSHLIESTVVMLELKFEHRNYLPSLGFLLLLVIGILSIANALLRRVVTAFSICVLSGMLYLSSSLWGQPLKAAMVWIEENPTSYRVYDHAAFLAYQYGLPEEVTKDFVRRSANLARTSTQELKYILVFCETYDGSEVDWFELANRVRVEPRDWSLYLILEDLLRSKIRDKCDLLTFDGYRALLNAYRVNPVYADNFSVLLMDELEIHAALHFGEPNIAIALEKNRNELMIPLAFKMKRAGVFASYGYEEFAAEQLEIGIAVAEKLGNESEFTLSNAKEMLSLIKGAGIGEDDH